MKGILIFLVFFLSLFIAVVLLNIGSSNSEDTILFSFINPKGNYSYITLSILTFVLGTISLLFIESLNQKRKKFQLLEMFLNDIQETISEIGSLKAMPTGKYFSRARFEFMGVQNITYFGIPEINFEVHNLKFYESKGYELAEMLKPKARKDFWHVYQLIRKAESVRIYLNTNKLDSQDYESYQKLFVELLKNLSVAMEKLWKELQKERSFFYKLSVST